MDTTLSEHCTDAPSQGMPVLVSVVTMRSDTFPQQVHQLTLKFPEGL